MVFGRSKKKGEKPAKPKQSKKPKAKAKPKRKSADGIAVKKRPTDIYTVMVMISLGFVTVAILFLSLELSAYDFPNNLQPWK